MTREQCLERWLTCSEQAANCVVQATDAVVAGHTAEAERQRAWAKAYERRAAHWLRASGLTEAQVFAPLHPASTPVARRCS